MSDCSSLPSTGHLGSYFLPHPWLREKERESVEPRDEKDSFQGVEATQNDEKPMKKGKTK